MLLHKNHIGEGCELVIFREKQNANQCLGRFIVFDSNDQPIFSGATLELPFINNAQNISSIYTGTFIAKKQIHKRFGKCIYICEVNGRNGIYIHVGNYHTQIEGCILVGIGHKYLNYDNLKDVYHSLPTMAMLYDSLDTVFELTIFSN